ncbi:MAG: SCO family protein [Myxococcales bacterium]|nr:SCO family protein [Myxococcales bacterium]MDH3483943.1 SCO family protein [Myxococcales bacterium]
MHYKTTVLLLVLSLLIVGCSKKTEPPPVLGQLPEFTLVDQNSQAFDRQTLEGDFWVADFIFTHCRSTCPRLTAHMQGLQTRLSDIPNAQFLSVSVDPRNDTPKVLKAYMAKNELSEANWRFVTGEEKAIREVVLNGFKVGLAEGDDEPGTEAIMHANHFVLVDERAQVRGYYRANNDGIADLERDLRFLASNVSSVR